MEVILYFFSGLKKKGYVRRGGSGRIHCHNGATDLFWIERSERRRCPNCWLSEAIEVGESFQNKAKKGRMEHLSIKAPVVVVVMVVVVMVVTLEANNREGKPSRMRQS